MVNDPEWLMSTIPTCPFEIGDIVRFTPSERTRGHYQVIERFGLKIGEEAEVQSIKDGVYVYCNNGVGGWPWNEFTLVRKRVS